PLVAELDDLDLAGDVDGVVPAATGLQHAALLTGEHELEPVVVETGTQDIRVLLVLDEGVPWRVRLSSTLCRDIGARPSAESFCTVDSFGEVTSNLRQCAREMRTAHGSEPGFTLPPPRDDGAGAAGDPADLPNTCRTPPRRTSGPAEGTRCCGR